MLAEAESMSADFTFPDERLKLLFVCAHPAIDARIHTALMLQVVLGLDAAAIAEAFLSPAATIGQRLWRAKTKIRDTRIAFQVPTGADLPRRFYRRAAAIVADPWLMCATEDFRYPETQGVRPPGLGPLNAYKGRLMALLASDDVLMRIFYEVVHMRAPAARLFAPDVVARVLASYVRPPGVPQPAPARPEAATATIP